jgi:hydroxysqualene synthase
VEQYGPVSVDHYENFPVASWLCPKHLRGAVEAIYRVARCADDLADEGHATPEQRVASLWSLQRGIDAALTPGMPAVRSQAADPSEWLPMLQALARAGQAHDLPREPFQQLLSAFRQDVSAPVYAHREELLDYCARSANPVGHLMLHLYGVHDAHSRAQSDAICSALQLINFWQDLSIDLPRGRHYVTDEDLVRHGLQRPMLQELARAGTAHPMAKLGSALVADLVAWARTLMTQGAPLALAVPGRAGWELRLVVLGGLRILDKMAARGFDAFSSRVKLTPRDAPTLVWQALHAKRSLWVNR